MDAPTSCIIDRTVLSSVEMVLKQKRFEPYGIHALHQLLVSLLIYDNLIWIDPHPPTQFLLSTGLYPDDDTPLYPLVNPPGLISCYQIEDADALLELYKGFVHTVDFANEIHVSQKFECPPDYLKIVDTHYSDFKEEALVKSIEAVGGLQFYQSLNGKDKRTYRKHFLATSLWGTDVLKHAADTSKTNGIIYRPSTELMLGKNWEVCKHDLKLNAHEKLSALEQQIIKMHIPPHVTFDFSPLVAILLDTSPTLAMIPETIMLMRRDYHALRDTARACHQALADAQDYNELSEVSKEWEDMWTKAIARIGSSGSFAHSSRIFTWDTVSPLSLRGTLAKVAAKVFEGVGEVTLRRTLSAMLNIEKEFLQSRRIEKNINRLFPECG